MQYNLILKEYTFIHNESYKQKLTMKDFCEKPIHVQDVSFRPYKFIQHNKMIKYYLYTIPDKNEITLSIYKIAKQQLTKYQKCMTIGKGHRMRGLFWIFIWCIFSNTIFLKSIPCL
ncbi:hypothetical protein ACJX0J_030781, partial [Zea mays]